MARLDTFEITSISLAEKYIRSSYWLIVQIFAKEKQVSLPGS
jgi:hypothetical protein